MNLMVALDVDTGEPVSTCVFAIGNQQNTVVAVKEQIGKVIGRVNTKVPAGDNEGEEEERGNVSSGLREAEKHVVPVNNPFPYAELGNCIAARRKGIVKEPDKLIVSFKEFMAVLSLSLMMLPSAFGTKPSCPPQKTHNLSIFGD